MSDILKSLYCLIAFSRVKIHALWMVCEQFHCLWSSTWRTVTKNVSKCCPTIWFHTCFTIILLLLKSTLSPINIDFPPNIFLNKSRDIHAGCSTEILNVCFHHHCHRYHRRPSSSSSLLAITPWVYWAIENYHVMNLQSLTLHLSSVN